MATNLREIVESSMRFRPSSLLARLSLRIALIYVVFGIAWILLSDQALSFFFGENHSRSHSIEIGKGLSFVFLTGILLYALVARFQRQAALIYQELEGMVRKRTEDLSVSNQELASANEEFRAINEELSTSNERLIEASKKIQEQNELIARQKDEQLNRVLDHSRDAIFSIDLSGKNEHYLSRSCALIFGGEVSQHVTDKDFWMNRTHPNDRAIRLAGRETLAREGKAEIVTRSLSDDGTYHWIYERHRYVYENGKPVRQEGIASDITEFRRQEEELNRHRENLDIIFANANENFLLLDHTGKVLLFNKAMAKAISFIIGREPTLHDYLWDLTTPERRELTHQLVARVAAGESIQVDARVPGEKGEIVLDVRYQGVFANGQLKHVIVLSTDVTEKRNQQVELNQYRENLDIIFSNTIEEILLLDQDGRVILFNRSFEDFIRRATGKPPIVGQHLWAITVPERADIARTLFARASKGEEITVDAEIVIDRQPRIHELRYSPVHINGEIKYVTIISGDVTEARARERAVSEYSANMRAIFESTSELFALTDKEGRLKAFNSAYASAMWSLSGLELKAGVPILDYAPPDRRPVFADMMKRAALGEVISFDRNFDDPSSKWFHIIIKAVYSPTGEFEGYCFSGVDITEVQKARLELTASEERFRELVQSSDDVFAIANEQLECTYVSPNVKRILGYEVAELIGKKLELIHPDELEEAQSRFGSVQKKEDGARFVTLRKLRHADGSWRWMEGTIINLSETPGIKGIVVVFHDVTERKQREQDILALKDSLSDFQNAIFRSSIVSRADRTGNITFVNDNFMRISGYPKEELLGKNHRIINSGYHSPEFWVDMWKTISRGQIWRKEVKNRAKDGTFYWVDTFIMPFLDENGRVREFLSIRNDITERKKAEEQVIQLNFSLADFKNAIHKSSIVSIADKKGNITYVNENFARISGYTEAELLGQNHRIVNSSFHEKAFWVNMWRTITAGKIWREEVKNRAKDGSFYWVDTFVMPFLDEQGHVREFLSIRNDITSRKKAEEELHQSKLLLDKANEVARIGYWTFDSTTGRASWNDRAYEILELDQSFRGTVDEFLSIIHPEDLARVQDAVDRSMLGQQPLNIDHRVVFKNGSIKWVHQEAKEVRNEKGEMKFLIGIIQDITERKNSEEILRQYNERYEILSKATNDAIWDWDIVSDFEIWNRGLETIFGYHETLIRNPRLWWKEMLHPADYDRVERTIQMAFQQCESHWSASYRYRCSDGSYKHVLDRAYIIYHDQKPVRMIGAVQDMTDQKRYLEEIEKLSLVASKTNNSVVITDPQDRIEWVNEGFSKLTGYHLNEVIGKQPGSFLQGPDTDPRTVQRISEKLKERVPLSEEIVNYSKTGRKYWLRLQITPVFNEAKELQHFIAIQSDISEQKEYEQRITAIAREMTSLIENANVPVFGVDRNGYINEWNKVAAELSEYSKNDVLGKKWINFLHPDLRNPVSAALRQVFNGDPVGNYELPFSSKGGNDLVFLVTISPRRDVNDNIVGAICVAQDLTELIRYRTGLERMVEDRTRELNEALRKEKELVEMKSKFVSIASHEFRTPLTTISIAGGFLKKYKGKLKADEIDKKIDSIEKQVHHMTYLLDDVLMIGKAEAGKIIVQRTAILLREWIERLVDEVHQSTGRTHAIVVKWNTDINVFNADEKLMRNIFINLLNNAIKFSPMAALVNMELSSTPRTLKVRVVDYGIGIPPEDLPSLFEAFHRGGNVSTIQGTGLGMSITKKAVELLGGTIHVVSQVNQGSEFVIELPILK